MKRTLFTIGLLIAVICIYAQRGMMNTNDRPSKWLSDLQQQLSLSNEQVQKLQAIDDKYESQEDSLEYHSKRALRDQRAEIRNEQMQEVKSVLTKSQLKEWEKMQASKTFKKGKKCSKGMNCKGCNNCKGSRMKEKM
ncbi:MAG: hypothetical protein WCU80_02855 [Paludibacteraceae bacterium]|nr:hypothetical protein [Prevotellaceae bacterium]